MQYLKNRAVKPRNQGPCFVYIYIYVQLYIYNIHIYLCVQVHIYNTSVDNCMYTCKYIYLEVFSNARPDNTITCQQPYHLDAWFFIIFVLFLRHTSNRCIRPTFSHTASDSRPCPLWPASMQPSGTVAKRALQGQ